MILGTHNAKFHFDEVLATAMLLNLYPDAKLLRTRFQDALDQCDIIYDVGSVYDSAKLRFDHHQRTFTETFSEKYDVKLSSAGLVYRHFAKKLLKKYDITPSQMNIDDIYEEYFIAVDASDNGIENPMKYKKRAMATIVSDFYMPLLPEDEEEVQNIFPNLIIPVKYQKKNDNNEIQILESTSRRFKLALKCVYRDFNNYMRRKAEFFKQLEEGFDLMENLDSHVLIVPKERDLTLESAFTLNKRLNKQLLFIIYCKPTGGFRIYTVRKYLDRFESVIYLNEEWRGLRDEELKKVSGIKTATFVHASGFTGGTMDLEDAKKMCEISIEKYHKTT
ncbi:Myg1-like protein [Pseudoloma neurophilia]|uniref:Myg1-like protein n=1 Tax=Pseudoloma neurophilia TaxID=146866 RepID=A0A0R0M1F0_9MICR|nr:Myg1-like protein [Pseudoloma neurophilia]